MIGIKFKYWLFFIAVVGSWLMAELSVEEDSTVAVVVENSPGYFSHNYSKREIDAQGILISHLQAKKMIHYSDDGTTHLHSLLMSFFNTDESPWLIESEIGVLQADKDHLLLSGNVTIEKEKYLNDRPFKINTSDLLVTLSTSFASTLQWAELIDGVNVTQGIGFEMKFSEPVKLSFLSNVKGRYVFK